MNTTSWPDVVMMVAVLSFNAFVLWIVIRAMK